MTGNFGQPEHAIESEDGKTGHVRLQAVVECSVEGSVFERVHRGTTRFGIDNMLLLGSVLAVTLMACLPQRLESPVETADSSSPNGFRSRLVSSSSALSVVLPATVPLTLVE